MASSAAPPADPAPPPPQQPRPLNVVFLGAEDTGKSTLVGHLLAKLGAADRRALERAEHEAVMAHGHADGMYAYVMYKRKAEREADTTMDLSVKCVEAARYRITMTDTPGTRRGVRFVARGVAGQDVAVLVVDAAHTSTLVPERVVADTEQGILYEHALVAYGLGVRQLVVAVNKMDLAKFEEARYEEMQGEVLKVLKKAGFNEEQRKKVRFVPVAGLPGDNLVELSGRMSWYERARGATLLEALAAQEPIARPTQPLQQEPAAQGGYAGLVLPVQFVVKVSGIGTVCLGRVEAGSVRPGMQITFLPRASQLPSHSITAPATAEAALASAEVATAAPPHPEGQQPQPCTHMTALVKAVECHSEPMGTGGSAGAGCSVGLALKGVLQQQVHPGWVACEAGALPRLVTLFRARILLKRDDLFTRPVHMGAQTLAQGREGKHAHKGKGTGQQCASGQQDGVPCGPCVCATAYCPVLDMGTGHVQCRLARVVHKLGKTGKPVEEPEATRNRLSRGDAAVVDLAPLWPVLVTPREECQVLGSFIIREKDYVVGFGGVVEVLEWWRPGASGPPMHPPPSGRRTKRRTSAGGGAGTGGEHVQQQEQQQAQPQQQQIASDTLDGMG